MPPLAQAYMAAIFLLNSLVQSVILTLLIILVHDAILGFNLVW